MAGRGPAPKMHHQRERDTRRRQADMVTLTQDGVVRGPDLEGPYSEQTMTWYRTWQTSPQAAVFLDTDWGRLQLMAPIVDAYFRRPSAAALSEIRLNEERLGATYVDRLRAKMRVEAADGQDGEVVPLRSVGGREDVLARLKGQK